MSTAEYIAHVKQRTNGDWAEPHRVEDHLRKVGDKAAAFAKCFDSAEWAQAAGLWHDLGKYRDAFQTHIKSSSGYRPDAHLEAPGEDSQHAIAGAVHAVNQWPNGAGQLLAYLIAGHHAGLPDWQNAQSDKAQLEWRLNQFKHHAEEALQADIPANIQSLSTPQPPKQPHLDCALWLRMLFSCLVDADFLDTESYMNPEKEQQRAGYPGLAELLKLFDSFMNNLAAKAEKKPSEVNQRRQEILADCIAAADKAPGYFTLTVPTGGGKTLASMAFALRHAIKHQKRRIIYVIPYTSIIEQTADVYREVFRPMGDEAIVEHHSNVDYDEASSSEGSNPKQQQARARARLAAENWDAPIVVTTAVQFFESLFAAKPSRCRKLHNIIDSVVIFDEAQTLPADFLEPVLAALKQLVEIYGVSAVLCTATQPTLFEKPAGRPQFPNLPAEKNREIISNPTLLYQQLKRVQVHVPENPDAVIEWPDLAERLAEREQVLCIVDTTKGAAELFALLPEEGRFHLSTRMCGQHRSDVLAVIKQRLKDELPTRVVSTQLIEAGVDVDFPVVYRAFAGLDSIAQAAGRCNREGRLATGDVYLFKPPSAAPMSLRRSIDAGHETLRTHQCDPLSLTAMKSFFQNYYWRHGEQLDKQEIQKLLAVNGGKMRFRTAAQKFKLIDDSWQSPVIVRYRNDRLLELLEQKGPERWLLRKLQRYVVNISTNEHHQLLNHGDIAEVLPGVFVQQGDVIYDDNSVGIQFADKAQLQGFGVL